ncbi:uncharacterized protein LOC113369434 [Ctenocephalides felis]|uniref:uncharacterized protein LOC113369434 n=1 Tax=Ctenocephalides felis TaxID=7515 RepID=UPI000E6E3A23|nr:uncharacterized protein LOC113369434 [Ctenocephalides felis]
MIQQSTTYKYLSIPNFSSCFRRGIQVGVTQVIYSLTLLCSYERWNETKNTNTDGAPLVYNQRLLLYSSGGARAGTNQEYFDKGQWRVARSAELYQRRKSSFYLKKKSRLYYLKS